MKTTKRVFLTVLEPSYTRVHPFQECRNSLVSHASKNFEWILRMTVAPTARSNSCQQFRLEGCTFTKTV